MQDASESPVPRQPANGEAGVAHLATADAPVDIRLDHHVIVMTFTRDILSQQMIDDTAAVLRQTLEHAPLPLKVVMDFSNIRHAGSNFLGMVMEAALKVAHRQGRMVVCSMTPEIADLFALTRLDKIVAIHPTQQQAIAALTQPDSTTNKS